MVQIISIFSTKLQSSIDLDLDLSVDFAQEVTFQFYFEQFFG